MRWLHASAIISSDWTVPELRRRAIETRAHLWPIRTQERRRRACSRLVFLKALGNGCSQSCRGRPRSRPRVRAECRNLGSECLEYWGRLEFAGGLPNSYPPGVEGSGGLLAQVNG